jgi:UPF0716 protein FxsA
MPLMLLFLFLALPILELYVIIQVGQAIGLAPTLLLLILDGLAGAALARSQGRNAWARFNRALAEGRVPARETLDGGMIVLGGALLLAPGFITDIFGFLLLIPPTRALLRGLVARLARRRVSFAWTATGATPPRPETNGRAPRSRTYDFEGTAHEVTDPPPEIEERP